jgi:hypothetical protein
MEKIEIINENKKNNKIENEEILCKIKAKKYFKLINQIKN